jgi:hypothetical protein
MQIYKVNWVYINHKTIKKKFPAFNIHVTKASTIKSPSMTTSYKSPVKTTKEAPRGYAGLMSLKMSYAIPSVKPIEAGLKLFGYKL